jgi:hypothetical protein
MAASLERGAAIYSSAHFQMLALTAVSWAPAPS